jgi:hypothetical protein
MRFVCGETGARLAGVARARAGLRRALTPRRYLPNDNVVHWEREKGKEIVQR